MRHSFYYTRCAAIRQAIPFVASDIDVCHFSNGLRNLTEIIAMECHPLVTDYHRAQSEASFNVLHSHLERSMLKKRAKVPRRGVGIPEDLKTCKFQLHREKDLSYQNQIFD